MRSFKAFFLRRRTSEKLLMTAFLAIGLLIWLSSFWTRASSFTTDAKSRLATLKDQKMWIDREPQIEKTTTEALSTFKSGASLTSSALISRLTQIGSRVGLGNSLTARSISSKSSSQFTLNTAQVTITGQNTNADWDKIQEFYKELLKERPNITLQTPFTAFTANASNVGRGGVTATFNVSAVEMKQR